MLQVSPNVLKQLGHSGCDVAARVGMSVVVLCVYPIMVVPMLAPVEGLIAAGGGGGGGVKCAAAIKVVATSLIVASVMLCTFFVADLGLMSVLAGAVSVAGFVALAPGLVGLWLSHRPGARLGLCWRAAMHALIWGGLALAIAGLFFRDNFVGELTGGGACWWRLPRETNRSAGGFAGLGSS